MTKRVAILLSGSGSNMVKLVEAMQSGQVNAVPVLVLSNKPDAAGLQKARALGVPTEVIDHRDFKGDRLAFEDAVHDRIATANVDTICLAGFMRILSASFIDRWAGKMLNTHPSLLPKYKGLHTHQRAIDAGDDVAGCSVHLVTAELDGGPVLGQSKVAILPNDTAETLASRVLVEEHKLYPRVLAEFVQT